MKNKLLAVYFLSFLILQSLFAQENGYKSGKKDGVWNYYGPDKVLLARHFYKDGERTGIWEFYTLKGVLSWTYNFKTSTANYILENTENGYYAYQNGDSSWIKKQPTKKTLWLASTDQWDNFLVNNLKFPESAVQKRIQGKVEIKVYVNDRGDAVKYELANNIDPLLNKEAVRVTRLFNPEFASGENNGTKVWSIYILKVSFKLADSR